MVAMALMLTGCSALTRPQTNTTNPELTQLKERLLELQRQVTVHEVEIAELKKRQVDRNPTSTPRQPSTPSVLSEAADATPEPSLGPLPSFENEDLPDTDATTPPPGTSANVSAPNDSESGLYEAALGRLRTGRFEEAEAAFRVFLTRFPETDLSDNASYWLGESLYSRGEYQQAYEAFRRTVERYPQGNKLPDALLKVGLCLQRTGDSIGSRDVLEEVVRRYPATEASTAAALALAAID